ncbi:MAG: class C beta-lactamase-related serine hydrolase [Chitinophagaceae bacterium]|nr:MAG: class C beta-lactamase-related serine hydrolase [Chitinophagaceae bacterium]
MKKRQALIKRLVIGLTGAAALYAVYYCSQALPVATGYGAKIMGSGIFISGRDQKDLAQKELDFWPLNLATFRVDYQDSSVTCSIAGMASSKAIFRKGLGVTLINGLSETEIRAQKINMVFPVVGNRDTIAWPMGDKIVNTYPDCVDSIAVGNAVARAFNAEESRAGTRDSSRVNLTRALVILYDGQVIAEKYATGYSASTRLTGWSMAKSVVGALMGILVKQKQIKIDEPAPVQQWKDPSDPRHHITIRHLLQQTTGLDFEEVYNKPSHANKMLFVEGDAAAFAAARSFNKAPGEDFRYSSGNTNILSGIMRKELGDSDYHIFPYAHLFYKLGMYNTVIEPDASGTFVGSSFCYATARDWARFGLLYLNNGKSNGEQLLPEDWVKQSVTPSTAAEQGEYGFQWWLNAGAKNNPKNRLYPELPVDMFYADGYEGQNIFVIPSKKLVVVRLGLTRTSHWGENELLKSVMAAIDTDKKQ